LPERDLPKFGSVLIQASFQVCGVGINFRADKTGALVVKNVVSNGATSSPHRRRKGQEHAFPAHLICTHD